MPSLLNYQQFENEAIAKLLKLRSENTMFGLEILSVNSYSNEFQEALRHDMKLLPLVFLMMCTFTSLVYYKHDKVKSSCLFLGLGAVWTVCMSLLSSFGVMFLIGVPFTNLTFMLPFIILGIGLDGKFNCTQNCSGLLMKSHTRKLHQRCIHHNWIIL